MKETDLCRKIQQELASQGLDISSKDISNLYISTLSNVYDILEKENMLEIPSLGSFWRKDGETSSVTFFKPIEKLIDRINRK